MIDTHKLAARVAKAPPGSVIPLTQEEHNWVLKNLDLVLYWWRRNARYYE